MIIIIGDLLENNMPGPSETYRRPTCLIRDPSKNSTCINGDWHTPSVTNIPARRPIGDQHTPSETDMPSDSNRNFNTFKYSYFYILFCLFIYIGIIHWGTSISDGSPMKHVNVSYESPIRHVGLRWVSDNNNIFVNSHAKDLKLLKWSKQCLLFRIKKKLSLF